MTPLKTALSIGAAWSLGLAAFGVFLTTLTPPEVPPDETAANRPASFRPSPAVAAIDPEPRPPIELDPVVIVAWRPRPSTRSTAEPEWNCDDWRPLLQGDITGRVRACEAAAPLDRKPAPREEEPTR